MAGGPDVWEIVIALRHTRKRGDARVGAAADQLGVAEQMVRAAVSFAAAHPDEVETMIQRNEAAAERGRAGGTRARAFPGLVRFLIDEMVSPAVARHQTDRGHDVQHVSDLGL